MTGPEYQCLTCGGVYSVPVWHCENCDSHYHDSDAECGNCYAERGDAETAYLLLTGLEDDAA